MTTQQRTTTLETAPTTKAHPLLPYLGLDEIVGAVRIGIAVVLNGGVGRSFAGA